MPPDSPKRAPKIFGVSQPPYLTKSWINACLILSRRPWKKSIWSRALHNCWTIYLNSNICDGNLSRMSMRERANVSNIVYQSLTVFYFTTWKRHILFRTWHISLLWIFIFPYTTYLVEKLSFHAQHKIKVYRRSTLYMKK